MSQDLRVITTHGVTFVPTSEAGKVFTTEAPALAFEAARRGGLRPIEAKRVRGVTEVTLAQRPRGTTTAMTTSEV